MKVDLYGKLIDVLLSHVSGFYSQRFHNLVYLTKFLKMHIVYQFILNIFVKWALNIEGSFVL